MIRADIATAALDEETRQRIQLAAGLIAAYRIRAKVREWDGTRCSLLVANYGDAYGQQACHIAARRGTPMLLFNGGAEPERPGIAHADSGSQVSIFAQQLRTLLDNAADDTIVPIEKAAHTPIAASPQALARPAAPLCRLASPDFDHRAVDAQRVGHRIHIRPALGRVYARSEDDLFAARDSLVDADWSLQLVPDAAQGAPPDAPINRSLDAFLLQTAFRAKHRLPDFPQGRYRLKDWPDIGAAPELVDGLKIAMALLRGTTDPDRLRSTCLATRADVNAALWAYRAAGLLDIEQGGDVLASISPPQEVGRFSGLLARIANRFGLGRAS